MEIGRAQPLEEMTSAAYGVARDAVAEAFAVDCQVSTFFATAAQPAVLPDEESRTRHVPSERCSLIPVETGLEFLLLYYRAAVLD